MVGKPGCGGGLLGSNGQRLGRRQLGWQVDIRWVRHRAGELRSELISVDGGEDGVGAGRAWGSIRRGLRIEPPAPLAIGVALLPTPSPLASTCASPSSLASLHTSPLPPVSRCTSPSPLSSLCISPSLPLPPLLQPTYPASGIRLRLAQHTWANVPIIVSGYGVQRFAGTA